MISAGVLRKIGNQVIFIDEVLGDTIEDTVVHLKDKKNSGKLDGSMGWNMKNTR